MKFKIGEPVVVEFDYFGKKWGKIRGIIIEVMFRRGHFYKLKTENGNSVWYPERTLCYVEGYLKQQEINAYFKDLIQES